MKRAVALGFFDGVHIGHGALLEKTVSVAKSLGVSPCVMTYKNHPSEVLSGKSVGLINTADERSNLISSLYGISDIVLKDFTSAFSEMPYDEFFEKILIAELSAVHIVAGFDFRFGHKGVGNASKLKELCENAGIGCDIIDEVSFGGEAVSSSRIRSLIMRGDMEETKALLGHFHCTVSEVIRGQNIGHTLGFATANQCFAENVLIPRRGVYVSRATVDGKTFPAITNIGSRPTISKSNDVFAETHILDFSENIYGKTLKLEFVRFLREEKKFSTKDELLWQISQDVLSARDEF